MGKVMRVLSRGGYREPFMCAGTCTASDNRSYDDAFLIIFRTFYFIFQKIPSMTRIV